tara:strand:- start:3754 stop:4884 length:1131 start_codon:yes stop_codon:yes gene_type:complete
MHVVIFFTYEYSLKLWNNSGILERELIYYKKLLNLDNNLAITLITYGDESDFDYQPDLNNFTILPVYSVIKKSNSKLINYLKSFFIPILINKKIQDVDVIKQYQLQGAWIAILYKYLIKKPLILRTGYDMYSFSLKEKKSLIKTFLYKSLTSLSLKLSNLYTVSTKSDFNFLTKKFKFDTSKIKVRSNWIILTKNKNILERNEFKILSVGRLEEQKNYKELIQTFKSSKFEIDIYGEGSQKEELIELSRLNHVKVNFKGLIDYTSLQNIYNDYRYYVSFSKYEGNPKTVLEAQAAGCVVITLQEQNTNELIENGISGIILKNSRDILSTIENLQYDEKKLKNISVAATASKNKKNEINLVTKKDYEDFLTLLNKDY